MAWPEVSIEDFPPQRDDEPASLRQDILDELTDHFACALNRELLKNSNEQLARQRVLNQFGDPIKVARQLWFDAMKEKIMSQRMMTGFSAVMAVCSIAVVAIAWMLMKESQSVNQKMLAQLALFAERSQQFDTVKKDQTKQNQFEPLNQISFQLVQEKKDGKPAVGFTGKLTKGGKQIDTFTVEAVSDQSGKLDFGKLPWGKYDLNLSSPWGESYHHSDLTVLPGRDFASQSIVCPASPPEETSVQFQITWTDKFKSEDWYLLCDFRNLFIEEGVGEFRLESTRSFQDDHWLNVQKQFQNSRGVYLINKKNQVVSVPRSELGRFRYMKEDTLIEKPSIKLLEGEYALPVIYLVQKDQLKKIWQYLNSAHSVEVLNHNRSELLSYHPFSRSQFNGSKSYVDTTTTCLFPFDVDNLKFDTILRKARGIQFPHQLKFSALKSQDNVWEIKLPEMHNLTVPNRAGGGQGFF